MPRDRIAVETQSRNTAENAVFSKRLIAPKPDEHWLLVTSALQMPRAMGAFCQAGFSGRSLSSRLSNGWTMKTYGSFRVHSWAASTDLMWRFMSGWACSPIGSPGVYRLLFPGPHCKATTTFQSLHKSHPNQMAIASSGGIPRKSRIAGLELSYANRAAIRNQALGKYPTPDDGTPPEKLYAFLPRLQATSFRHQAFRGSYKFA